MILYWTLANRGASRKRQMQTRPRNPASEDASLPQDIVAKQNC